jgi:hypothetical protein
MAMTQVFKALAHCTCAAVLALLAAAAVTAPVAAQVTSQTVNVQALRRCEDELNFRMSREFGGRASEVILNRRRAEARQNGRNNFQITGPGRYLRDSFDRPRQFTYRCVVNMNSGQANVQYNWTDTTFDPEYDVTDPGYPPAWAGQGLSPQGRVWFSGGVIARSSGKGLDVENRSTQDSAAVQQWDFANAPNQRWDVIDLGRGEFAFVSEGSNKVLDVQRGSTDDGGAVIQYRWNGGENQRWRLVRAGAGHYQIVNVGSGKCLDVQNNSQDNGARVQQWSCAGAPNQQWRLQGQGETTRR